MNQQEWTGIGHEALPQIRQPVSKFIEDALHVHGYYQTDVEYFLDRIEKEEMQLWIIFNQDEGITGVLLSELVRFQNETICSVPILGGGSLEVWEEFLEKVLVPWAKFQKVDRLEIRARKGFKPAATRHDFYVSECIFTRKLTRKEN